MQSTYYQLAKVTGERDAARAQLDREEKRRDADRAKWGAEMERLRKDRERFRLLTTRLQSEIKRLKLQDENTVVIVDGTAPNTERKDMTAWTEKRGREETEDSHVSNSEFMFPHSRTRSNMLVIVVLESARLRSGSKVTNAQDSSDRQEPRTPLAIRVNQPNQQTRILAQESVDETLLQN